MKISIAFTAGLLAFSGVMALPQAKRSETTPVTGTSSAPTSTTRKAPIITLPITRIGTTRLIPIPTVSISRSPIKRAGNVAWPSGGPKTQTIQTYTVPTDSIPTPSASV